jgi:tRNA splicing endonuclease
LKNKKEEQSREILPSEQLSELPRQQLNPKSNQSEQFSKLPLQQLIPKSNQNPNFAAQNRSPKQQKLIKIETLQDLTFIEEEKRTNKKTKSRDLTKRAAFRAPPPAAQAKIKSKSKFCSLKSKS